MGSKGRMHQRNASQALISAIPNESSRGRFENLIQDNKKLGKVSSHSSMQQPVLQSQQNQKGQITSNQTAQGPNPYNMQNFTSSYQFNPLKKSNSVLPQQQPKP